MNKKLIPMLGIGALVGSAAFLLAKKRNLKKQEPFEFDFDVDQLLAGQALELDAAEILKEVMPKLPEPFSKYIDTLEEEEEEPETIEVTPKDDSETIDVTPKED